MNKFIPPAEIEEAASDFLKKHHPSRTAPIPIEELLDLKLGINIVPVLGLQSDHNIDAFLSLDFEDIYIDQHQLEHRPNRARFSLAHETGHLVLHRDYIGSLNVDSIERWKKMILGKGSGHAFLETQANMFAGFLLMPTSLLATEFKKEKEAVKGHPMLKGRPLPDDKTLAPFIAKKIAKVFDVSEEAASNRLSSWIGSS